MAQGWNCRRDLPNRICAARSQLYRSLPLYQGTGSPRALFGVASSGGEQIWATDGTVQGTVRLPVSALPNEVYPVGSSYYLTGYDATGAAHLYPTHAPPAGTIALPT